MNELIFNIKIILSALTNREIAIVLWCFIVGGYFLCNADRRKLVAQLLRCLYNYKLLLSRVFLYVIIGLITFTLYKYDVLTRISTIKDVVIYCLFTAIPILYKSVQDPLEINRTVLQSIKATAIIAIYINLFSFNLIVEIFLLPIIVILVALSEYAKIMDAIKYDKIIRCLNFIIGIVSSAMIIYTIYMTITTSMSQMMELLAKAILLPLFLTIIIVPYAYLVAVISKYEQLFVFIKIRKKRNNIFKENHYMAWQVAMVKMCLFNVFKIDFFAKNLKIFNYFTDYDFYAALEKVNMEYEKNRVIR